ncbi:MAG: hypothetical protein ACRDWT_00040 [Jatrophihabitantaceae bacterium]
MNSVAAIDSSDITKIGIGATVAVVVIGLLLSMIITALVARVVILVIVVLLGVFIWQQRSVIEDHVKKCQLNMSYFGVHVDAPKSVQDRCHQVQ